MRNIALILMYNGTAYHGWQVQKTERTVAQTLERCGASRSSVPAADGRTQECTQNTMWQISALRPGFRWSGCPLR